MSHFTLVSTYLLLLNSKLSHTLTKMRIVQILHKFCSELLFAICSVYECNFGISLDRLSKTFRRLTPQSSKIETEVSPNNLIFDYKPI